MISNQHLNAKRCDVDAHYRKESAISQREVFLKIWELKKEGYGINKNFLGVWLGKKVQAETWRRCNIREQKGAILPGRIIM